MNLDQMIQSANSLPMAMLFAAVIYLWRELKSCQRAHRDCEANNLLLARAVEDVADGKYDEARKKAAFIVDALRPGHQHK